MKKKTCAIDGCDGEFAGADQRRRYCDDHRTPGSRRSSKSKAKISEANLEKLRRGLGGDLKAVSLPAKPIQKSASAHALLELAGFRVTAVQTPRGEMLLVEAGE